MDYVRSAVAEGIASLRRMNKRDVLSQILSLVTVVLSALMLWKGLMVVTGSESPIVVVLSGSMQPGFERGDLLFLTMDDSPIQVGEIVVFKITNRDIPIVHRVIEVRNDTAGNVRILTKGDYNPVDDRGLYAPGQQWLTPKDIVGRAKAYVPYIGMATILMNDYPKLKYLLLATLAFTVITSKE